MISRINCLALWLFAVIAATGCARAVEPLTAADVNTIVAQAVQAAGAAGVTHGFIAVSDREGFILGLYSLSGTPAATDFGPVNAIDKAGTAAFLSSNGEAFTSRTAGYIIQAPLSARNYQYRARTADRRRVVEPPVFGHQSFSHAGRPARRRFRIRA